MFNSEMWKVKSEEWNEYVQCCTQLTSNVLTCSKPITMCKIVMKILFVVFISSVYQAFAWNTHLHAHHKYLAVRMQKVSCKSQTKHKNFIRNSVKSLPGQSFSRRLYNIFHWKVYYVPSMNWWGSTRAYNVIRITWIQFHISYSSNFLAAISACWNNRCKPSTELFCHRRKWINW